MGYPRDVPIIELTTTLDSVKIAGITWCLVATKTISNNPSNCASVSSIFLPLFDSQRSLQGVKIKETRPF